MPRADNHRCRAIAHENFTPAIDRVMNEACANIKVEHEARPIIAIRYERGRCWTGRKRGMIGFLPPGGSSPQRRITCIHAFCFVSESMTGGDDPGNSCRSGKWHYLDPVMRRSAHTDSHYREVGPGYSG